jgi:hypothetical protein
MIENVHKYNITRITLVSLNSAPYGVSIIVIGGVVGVLIIVMILLGIIFLRRKKGNIYNYL